MSERSDQPPFTRLSSEIVVRNPWHCYRKDRYVRRDGTVGDYFHVDMPGSAGVIPVLPDGRAVLCEVRRYLLGTTLVEFPIGGMKQGEDPAAVAARECAEETGYRPRRITPLGRFAPYKGASNEVCWFFLGEDLEHVGQDLESSEEIRTRLVPLRAVRALLLDSPLGDGQSLVAWLYLERLVATPAGAHLRPWLGS